MVSIRSNDTHSMKPEVYRGLETLAVVGPGVVVFGAVEPRAVLCAVARSESC